MHEVLLRPQNGARPDYPDPPDERRRTYTIVLHGVAPDEAPCSPQPGLAVHRDASGLVFTNSKEFVDNLLTGHRPVNEVKVGVADTIICEASFIVQVFVESYDVLDANLLENGNVVLRSESVFKPVVPGSHECSKLGRDDPIDVSVFDLLVVLVFLDIEGPEIVPITLYRELEAS